MWYDKNCTIYMKKQLLSTPHESYQTDTFARIDWKKVTPLFQREMKEQKNQEKFRSAERFLEALAGVGIRGLTFLFNAAKPGAEGILMGEYPIMDWREKQLITRFQKQKYVEIVEGTDGKTTVKITQHGMKRALSYHLDTLALKKQKGWDGKWRVVIFDVPERYRKLRNAFRQRLRQLNLYPLQESVYVSPYPCFDEVEFLRELFGVSVSVRYLVAEKIEEDSAIKTHFNLPFR